MIRNEGYNEGYKDFDVYLGVSAIAHLGNYIDELNSQEIIAMLSRIGELAREKFYKGTPVEIRQSHIKWLGYHADLDLSKRGIQDLLKDKK